jgi:L,D-transpeptidase ErfK/SrfK
MTKRVLAFVGAIIIIITAMFPAISFAQIEKTQQIIVNIPSLTLQLIENGKPVAAYPVAVGKDRTQTPIGDFTVTSKVINPTWFPTGKPPVPPGPSNPLGIRWIGLKDGYGIHGNNNPKSIGSLVSLGCIRMFNEDVVELYNKVKVGTPVSITYDTMMTLTSPYDGSRCVVLYPDVYKLGVNRKGLIRKYLLEAGVQIAENKIDELTSVKSKRCVCSYDMPAFFINNEFVTSDVLQLEEGLAVSAVAVSNYFGTAVLEVTDGKAILPGGMILNLEQQDEIYYILFEELERVLETSIVINDNHNEAQLNVNTVMVNGRYAGTAIKNQTGAWLVPIKQITELLGLTVFWNDETKSIYIDGSEVPVSLFSGKSYLTPERIQGLFGFDFAVDESRTRIDFTKIEVFLDGTVFEDFVYTSPGPPLLAVRTLAESLGEVVGWNGRAAVVEGIEITGEMINGSLYVKPDEVAELLGLYIGWNPQKGRLVIISGKRRQ